MRARTIDLETTGLPDDDIKEICEIGFTDVYVETQEVRGPTSHFVDPGHPIPPHIRSVHHISNQDVRGAMSPFEAHARLFREMNANEDVFVAHNAEFEQYFFSGGDVPWVCTLKCAQVIWPDAPKFNNQTLRYWLGLELSDELAMPPHRAGPDTYVTAHIFIKMLQHRTIQELVHITQNPIILKVVSFGKHKGKPWSEVPKDYLQFIVSKGSFDRDTEHTAKHWLKGE